MAKENFDSTILHEHRRIVTVRYILAAVNFLAILLGTVVTRYFLTVRGSSDAMLLHVNILAVINLVQLLMCVSDYFMRCFIGIYKKAVIILSYIVGALWLLTTIGMLYVGSTDIGALRFDLLIIAGLQLFSAFLAYFIWPTMDYSAVQTLTRPKVRDDMKKRKNKSQGYVIRYALICIIMVCIQAGLLFAYQLPPKVYDLFSETRALEYRLNDDKTGYYVAGIYKGTSSYVQVPETFNNLPVVGISAGALSDTTLLAQYKVEKIDIGVEKVDESGKTVLVSQVKYIEKGGITNDKIETLRIPSSVISMAEGAIDCASLKTIIYEAAADFSISVFNCESLTNVTMAGDQVGNIISLDGISEAVTIEVDKDIYNLYRKNNIQYGHSLKPILSDTEFYVDFYTDCDYYIESIFGNLGEGIVIGYEDLKNDGLTDAVSLVVDTLAYIKNPHELGTAGAKDASAFRGWYLDRSLSVPCKFTEDGKITFNKTTAVYAKWIDEYTGQLNWGTYQPPESVTTMYWTDEDIVAFPVESGREGYSEGVRWYMDGNEANIMTSESISENITLNAVWLLDAPTVDIALEAVGNWFNTSPNNDSVEFTYDENHIMTFSAVHSHALDKITDQSAYEYLWTKKDSADFEKDVSTISVQNVKEQGEYVLTIRFNSPYGETSEAVTDVKVAIAQKELDIGDVRLIYHNEPYTSLKQTVRSEGNYVHDNIEVSYVYTDVNGKECGFNDGVSDAGRYTVTAEYKKDNPAEAENYTTKQLVSEFIITPRELTFDSWTNGDLIYNGESQSVEMLVTGIFSDDEVVINYSNNEYTDAGTYTAAAIGVSNPNYSIAGIVEHCRYTWEIDPKEVSVKRWTMDGNQVSTYSVTYNGSAHTIAAIPDGICSGDTVNFIYSGNVDKVSETNADEYSVKIIGVDNDNYTFNSDAASAELAWSIEPKVITATFASVGTITYNGNVQGINATVSGIVAADLSKFTNATFLYDEKSDVVEVNSSTSASSQNLTLKFTAVNANTYRAAISSIDSNAGLLYQNYRLSEAVAQDFTISPKTINIVNDTNYVYNGKEQSLTISVEGIIKADLDDVRIGQFKTSADSETLVSGEVSDSTYQLSIKGTNADSYAIAIESFDNSNYYMEPYSDTIDINKKALTVEWTIMDERTQAVKSMSSNSSVTYNANGYTVIATPNGVQNGETVELVLDEFSQINVAEYTTTATLPEGYSNYVMSPKQIHWSIEPYRVDFTWNFNGQPASVTGNTFEYNTEAVEVTPQYKLLDNDTITLTYSSAESIRTDVGEYTVAISGLNNVNYTLGSGTSVRWKITPKQVLVSWPADNEQSVMYNGSNQGPTFTLSGLLEKEDLYVRTGVNSKRYDFRITSPATQSIYQFAEAGLSVNADDYTFSVLEILTYDSESETYVVNNNYQVVTDTYEFTIEKRPLTLSGSWNYTNAQKEGGLYNAHTQLVYNAQNYVLTTEIVGGLVPHLGEPAQVDLVYDGNTAKNYRANGYTAKVSALSGIHASNYSIPTGGSTMQWAIQKKAIDFIWTHNDFVYNGSNQYQNATFETGATSDTDGKVYSGDQVTLTYSGNAQYEAGRYNAKVSAVSNPNYTVGNGSTYEWIIEPKSITLTWTTTSLVYNGEYQAPLAYYAEDSSVRAETYSAITGKNIGTHLVEALTLNNSNYKLVGNNTCHYTITPKTIVLGWQYNGNSNAGDYTYDAVERKVNAVALNLCDGDTVAFTYNSATLSVKNAGTYQFEVTALSNPNYQIDASSSAAKKSITVNQYTVTIEWSENQFEYDGKYHYLTPTVKGVDSSIELEYVLSSSVNYLKDVGSLTVAVSELRDDNYKLPSSKSKTLQITAKPVTITWSGNTNVTYDGKSHALTATVTGVNNEVVSFSYTTAGNSAVNAGTHTFTVTSLGNSNYTLSGASNRSCSLVINPQPVKITWPVKDPSYMYDGTTYYLTPDIKGATDGLNVDVKNYSSGNYLTQVGSKTVQIKSLADSNYTLTGATGDLTNTLTITPQPVVITWPEISTWTYDGTYHSFMATVLGKNDQETVPVSYQTSYSLINAGTYTVTLKLNSNNYTLEGSTGTTSATAIVLPQKVSITWTGDSNVVYDGSTHRRRATVVGAEDGKNVSIIYETSSSFVDVGDYQISFRLDSDNYTMEGAAGTNTSKLTIVPQPVEITWTGAGIVEYTGSRYALTATVKGANDGKNVGFGYDGSYSFTEAGEHSASIFLTDTNYTLEGVEGSTSATLTIKPQAVQISWSGIGVYEYNGGTHTLVATVRGVSNGQNVAFTYSGENSYTDVGTYQVSVKLDNENYTLDNAQGSVSASLTINPQPVMITWTGTGTVTYDGNPHAIEATVTGFKDGSVIEFTYDGENSFTEIGDHTVSVGSLSNGNYTLENAEDLTSPTLSIVEPSVDDGSETESTDTPEDPADTEALDPEVAA